MADRVDFQTINRLIQTRLTESILLSIYGTFASSGMTGSGLHQANVSTRHQRNDVALFDEDQIFIEADVDFTLAETGDGAVIDYSHSTINGLRRYRRDGRVCGLAPTE